MNANQYRIFFKKKSSLKIDLNSTENTRRRIENWDKSLYLKREQLFPARKRKARSSGSRGI
jgi:hypothetical protein